MRNRTILIIITAVIFFMVVSPIFAVEEGEAAPAFVLTDLNKDYVFSKKVYGTGWILIDFYATYCEHCNEELPLIEGLFQEFRGKGLKAYLLATDAEGYEKLMPFFSSSPTGLTVLVDKYQKASTAFGVSGLPSIFLVDPDGKIVLKLEGYDEAGIEKMREILAKALNE